MSYSQNVEPGLETSREDGQQTSMRAVEDRVDLPLRGFPGCSFLPPQ